ncbi:MAG: adenylate/guanylate cyclase domain-containing protein [Cyanobacteria bacterium P01_D01_bin.73]
MLAKIKPVALRLGQWLHGVLSPQISQAEPRQPRLADKQWPQTVAIAVLVAGGVWGAESLGWLQRFELAAYDLMVQVRGQSEPDSRLLIIGIDDADIARQDRWPLADATLAKALENLQKHRPATIGIDIYRDLRFDPGHGDFVRQLNVPNVVTIRAIEGVKHPIAYGDRPPLDQVGFNDVVLDADGVVRRNLLVAETSGGFPLFSFPIQLAKKYFAPRRIRSRNNLTNPEWMDFGEATFLPLTQTAGAYHDAKEDFLGYQILLDYRHYDRIAPKLSLSEVLDEDFDPALVQGKIVLIGSVADSLRDVFFTPHSANNVSRPKIPGVYIHAQSVLQIMDAVEGTVPLLTYWADWQEFLWMALWVGFGCGASHFSKRPLLAIALTGLGGGAIALSTLGLFIQGSVWVPWIAPTLGLGLGTGATLIMQAQQSRRQKLALLGLLEQNTSRAIAQSLWENREELLQGGRLPGRRVTATILFSDIRNFSPVAEQMEPEALLEWLNQYLVVISESVQGHGGTVNKFMGDGMMALFGVPVPRTNAAEVAADAQNAVDCALAIQDGLVQLNQRFEEQGLPPIQIRIGIFTGPVVVGSMGGRQRWEYGALGSSVNIAARLEGCVRDRQTGICRILLARETLVHLGGHFQVESWGPLTMKGVQKPVDVYQVLGRIKDGDRLDDHNSHIAISESLVNAPVTDGSTDDAVAEPPSSLTSS